MMFVLATGMRGGARAGLLAMLGVVFSEIVQIAVVAVGLSALFAEVPVVALLPQLVDHGMGDIPLQFAVLGAIFVAFEVLVDGTVGLASGRIGGWLSRRRRARQGLDAGSGTVMVALAVAHPGGQGVLVQRSATRMRKRPKEWPLFLLQSFTEGL